jgi:hypothetical protein
MRVVQATRFGGPEVLVTSKAPDPFAGRGRSWSRSLPWMFCSSIRRFGVAGVVNGSR